MKRSCFSSICHAVNKKMHCKIIFLGIDGSHRCRVTNTNKNVKQMRDLKTQPKNGCRNGLKPLQKWKLCTIVDLMWHEDFCSCQNLKKNAEFCSNGACLSFVPHQDISLLHHQLSSASSSQFSQNVNFVCVLVTEMDIPCHDFKNIPSCWQLAHGFFSTFLNCLTVKFTWWFFCFSAEQVPG